MEPLRILMNDRAGLRGPPGGAGLAGTLAERGIRAVIEVVEPARLAGRVRQLAGIHWLGVAGGDGTQRTAARGLAGTATVLVPFPTGRLNHFSRRLGLDTVESTVDALRAGRVRTLSIGRANGHPFVNTAVIGSYVRMIRIRERLRPFLTNWPAATLASLVVLARWTEVDLDSRSPGPEIPGSTAMFWVGIGRGSFPYPHRAPLPEADPVLEFVTLPTRGRRAALTLAGAVFRHRVGRGLDDQEGIDVFHGDQIELDSEAPIPVALDGEPHYLEPPLRIAVETGVLRTLAPMPDG